MGIAAELGYEITRPGTVRQSMQALAATRPGAWLFSKTLRHADDVVGRLTGGRWSVPELVAGLPVIDVVTTGRRSGSPRRTHLISVPVGDTLAVLGTNFGQPSTPAWSLNLEADPRATVSYRGRTVQVVARAATGSEEAQVWERSAGVYGGYATYRERLGGRRRVRVFVLEPARADR